MKGAKSPLRVQSTRIFKLFRKFKNTHSVAKRLFRHADVIMIGNPGRGKTHLSIALGLKACTRGYNVLFKNAATLSTELCEAKDNYHLGKLERTLAKADLLILDELSYLSFNRHQSDGVLATPFRCVAFHDTPLYAEKPPYRFHPYGGRRFICRTSRCATRCGLASAPAHHPRYGK